MFIDFGFLRQQVYNYQILTIPFSSDGFSIISAWNDDTFVESLLNSTYTKYLDVCYLVPSGVNIIKVTYITNHIFVSKPKNIWTGSKIINFTNNIIIGTQGVTLYPEGKYVFSFDITYGTLRDLYFYSSIGECSKYTYIYNSRVYTSVNTNGYPIERIFIRENSQSNMSITNIQLEYTNWSAYSSSPDKGSWIPMTFGTVFKPIFSLDNYSKINSENKWIGKTINFNGDSVTQMNGSLGYVKIVSQLLEFGTVNNYAIGGTRLAHKDGLSDDNPEVINCMVDRYQDMDTNADIVFIMANTNDYASQIPIGNDDDSIRSTYKGALNIIFSWLKTTYPTQPIIISTMLTRKINYGDDGKPLPITIEQYAQAIRDMTSKYGFILYDAYILSGLDLLNSPTDGTGITNDRLHPNEAGSLSLGRKIAAFIKAQ